MNIIIFIAVCIFILLIICFIVVSIKYFKYFNNLQEEGFLPLFIDMSDGDELINIEELEHITQAYNTIEKQFEIIYFSKSGHQVKEVFDNKVECEYKFQNIKKLLQ